MSGLPKGIARGQKTAIGALAMDVRPFAIPAAIRAASPLLAGGLLLLLSYP